MDSLAYHGPIAPAPVVSLALQRALQSWGGVLESLPVAISACDLDGYLVQYNRRAAELWGQSPPIGDREYRFSGAYKAYEPSGAPLSPSNAPMAELLRTGRPVRDRELLLERPDGGRITILANLDPLLDARGKLVGGVSCFQDITERKAAEERLRAHEQWYRDLLDALPAAIYTTDAEGRITFCNRAAEALAGRQPSLGSDEWCVTWRLYSADGTPLAHENCPMAVALREGKPVREVEKIVERPDGTRIPVIPYPTPLRDASGAIVGAVNMLVDITERKRAEEQKTLLLRELAHRVNNTFAVILAMAQQSLRTAPSPQVFSEAFTGRLQALAKAHNLLLDGEWAGADLGDLARSQAGVFCPADSDRLTIAGPPAKLGPTQVIAFGLVLHELATNACKHGALSVDTGRVELGWDVRREDGADHLHLTWTERHGPAVAPPSRQGLGSRLIARGLPDAAIDWRFEPDGVVCTIDLPLEAGRPTNGMARLPSVDGGHATANGLAG